MSGRPPLRIGAHGRIHRHDAGGGVWVARCRFRDTDGIVRLVERRTPEGVVGKDGEPVVDKHGKLAEDALLDALDERRAPTAGVVTPATLLPALCSAYVDRIEADGRSPRTIDTYRYNLRKLSAWSSGIRVGECTAGRVDAVIQSMLKAHGPTIARQSRTILNGALGLAVRDGVLTTNPVRDVDTIKSRSKPKGAPALAADQLRDLVTAVVTDPECVRRDLADPLIMFVATGLRRSELLALAWTDVDEERFIVNVSAKVVRVRGIGLVRVEETKTAAGARTISLPKFAMTMLQRRAAEDRPNDHGVIFPSSTGSLRDPDNFNTQWRKVRDRLGLPDVTSHSFRKSLATLIDDAGLSARVGADHLGHSHVSMTQDRYFGRGRIHSEVAELLDSHVTSGE